MFQPVDQWLGKNSAGARTMEACIPSGANCVISMNARWCVHVSTKNYIRFFCGSFITQATLVFLHGFARLHVDDNTEIHFYSSCYILRFVCHNERKKTRSACQVHRAGQTHRNTVQRRMLPTWIWGRFKTCAEVLIF